VWPTVQMAVLPATTPESATDFFGLNSGVGVVDGELMADWGLGGTVAEQRNEGGNGDGRGRQEAEG
jgi:hypothetical protein